MDTVALRNDRPFMTLSAELVAAASANGCAFSVVGYVVFIFTPSNPFSQVSPSLKTLVKLFILHSLASNHTPALPGVSYLSQWIGRESASALGFRNHRVTDDGGLCYPSPAGYDSCWPNVHFVYEAQLK